MALAIFDLDNTLLSGDSDHLWGVYLTENNIVDASYYEKENDRFYREYKDGTLDIMEFLTFSLKPLSQHSIKQLDLWHEDFLKQKIIPLISSKTKALIKKHKDQGDTLLVITATNHFVTAPIVKYLGIEHIIATNPEIINGAYTGAVNGIPSFKEGKIERLNAWLSEEKINMDSACFYSDSINDLSLLELVEHPIAVDPDEKLEEIAKRRNWPILSLRLKT